MKSTFPRRRWLLVLAAALMIGWLGFLVYLATSARQG